jgi:secondary thiamine-phosphate synthase enzyme
VKLKTSGRHSPILPNEHDGRRQRPPIALEDDSMETLAPPATCRHITFAITSTRPTEFIDLTDRVAALAASAGSPFGFVNVQTRHTTTAVVVNEREPLLLCDFDVLLQGLAPHHVAYRHDDPVARTVNVTAEERRNGHAHCRALLLPTSACLNVVGGRLQLGRWQRIFLVELDGPRPREVSVLLVAAAGPERHEAA